MKRWVHVRSLQSCRRTDRCRNRQQTHRFTTLRQPKCYFYRQCIRGNSLCSLGRTWNKGWFWSLFASLVAKHAKEGGICAESLFTAFRHGKIDRYNRVQIRPNRAVDNLWPFFYRNRTVKQQILSFITNQSLIILIFQSFLDIFVLILFQWFMRYIYSLVKYEKHWFFVIK